MFKIVSIFTSKIHIGHIISAHLGTLKNNATGKASLSDYILFYLFPLSVGGGACLFGYRLNDVSVGVMLAAFAILTGFLFNLLVFLFELVDKAKKENPTDTSEKTALTLKKILLRETTANISYGVLIGIFLSVSLVLAMISNPYWVLAMSIISFTLMGNFMFTLLMILKRFIILLEKEL